MRKKGKTSATRKLTPYQALANAVIEQAARDYRLALRRGNEGSIATLERFFLSEWFIALSDLNGEALMFAIRKDVENRGKSRNVRY